MTTSLAGRRGLDVDRAWFGFGRCCVAGLDDQEAEADTVDDAAFCCIGIGIGIGMGMGIGIGIGICTLLWL